MNTDLSLAVAIVFLGLVAAKQVNAQGTINRADLYAKQQSITYNSGSLIPSSADSINCKFYFLKGLGNKISGNTDAAIENFNESLKYDARNDAAYYELALANFNTQKYADAIHFIKIAININPKQIWYLNLLATIDDQKSDFQDLASVYKKMVALDPANVNYYLGEAAALTGAGHYQQALGIYSQVEKITGLREDIEFQKQKIYLKTNQASKALESMNELIRVDPIEPKYYLLMAEIYRAQNLPQKVLGALKMAVSIDSTNGYAQLALADYYRSVGDKANTYKALQYAFLSDDIDLEQKKRLIQDNYVNVPANDQHEGMVLAGLIAKSNPEDTQSQALYAAFLTNSPDGSSEARNAIVKILEKNKINFSLWAKLIISDFNIQEYTLAVEHTENALIYFPNQLILYWYDGIALNQLSRYKEAVDKIKQGLALASGQKDMEAQLYQILGDAFHGEGQNHESDEAYDASLIRRPEDAGTLNNYAYYLCLRHKDSDKASDMASKANLIEPENSNYEDTYAWVLYHQHKYDMALHWIEKALAHSTTQSPTLLDHYGDILFKLGKIDEAIENWKKAKAFGSKDLNLNRKISNKKVYE